MAIVARASITITDFTDSRSAQLFIRTDSERVQTYKANSKQPFSPDWTKENVTLTPMVYLTGEMQDDISNVSSFSWEKNGKSVEDMPGHEVDPITKELTISKNVMEEVTSVTYSLSVTVPDEKTGLKVRAEEEIVFTRVTDGEDGNDAHGVFLVFPRGNVFKGDGEDELREIEALYYEGVREIRDNLDVKWYYQDPYIRETDDSYDEDGGLGWSLISDTNNNNEDISGYGTTKIAFTESSVEGTQSFKVVVRYGGLPPVSAVTTVMDISDPYQAVINGNLSFRPETKESKLEAHIYHNKRRVKDISKFLYSWFIYDEDGELLGGWTQSSNKTTIGREHISKNGHILVDVIDGIDREIVTSTSSSYYMVEDGEGNFTWVMYASGPNGEDMSEEPGEGLNYMGVLTTKENIMPDPSDFVWKLIKGEDGKDGEDGRDGGEVQYLHVRYSANSNGANMTEEPVNNTRYIGILATFEKEPSQDYRDYSWSLFRGHDGMDGPPGIEGEPGIDGETTYTWVKYADTPTSGMSDFPDGKKYIGFAFNRKTQEESKIYSDYEWKLMPQNIEVGGRNLLRNSDENHSGEYLIASYQMTQNLRSGERVSVQLGGTLAGEKDSFTIRNSTLRGDGVELVKDSDGIYKASFRWAVKGANNILHVHAERESQPGVSHIEWIQLERGDMYTDWTPAPEDAQDRIENQEERIVEYRKEIDKLEGTASLTIKEIEEMGGIISEHESRLEASVREISGKLSSTEYFEDIDGIVQRIEENKFEIEATAKGLTTRVSREDLQKGLDGIEIGARNLILNSDSGDIRKSRSTRWMAFDGLTWREVDR